MYKETKLIEVVPNWEKAKSKVEQYLSRKCVDIAVFQMSSDAWRVRGTIIEGAKEIKCTGHSIKI